MSNQNPLSENSRKRKNTNEKSSEVSVKKDELCTSILNDITVLRNIIINLKKPDVIKKRAIIRSVCNLGSRLCFIRDSDSIEKNTEIKEYIKSIISYRNQFLHKEIYMDPNEKDNLFSTLLEKINDKQIDLSKINGFVVKLSLDEKIKTVKNSIKDYKYEDKEDKESQEKIVFKPYENIIKIFKACKEEAEFLESIQQKVKKDPGKKELQLSLDHCIGNIFQAFSDYRNLLGSPTTGNAKTLKKLIESDDAKTKINADALNELQHALEKRRDFAHIDEVVTLKTDSTVFLENKFSDYFQELLKNTKKMQEDKIASNAQTSQFQDKAVTPLTEQENANNNSQTLPQFEQSKNSQKNTTTETVSVVQSEENLTDQLEEQAVDGYVVGKTGVKK